MAFWSRNSGTQSALALAKALDRSQAVIEFGLDGSILTANQIFLDTFGYTLAEIRGKDHSMLVEPRLRDAPAYADFWAGLRRGEFQSGEFNRIGKGGKQIWLQATYAPILDRAGKPTGVVTCSTDTTVQKQRSLEAIGLMDTLLRWQAVIEFEMDGTIITANQIFLDLMGYTLAEIQGKPHSMFVDPATRDSSAYRELWSNLRKGKSQSGVVRQFSKAGNEMWVFQRHHMLFDENGAPIKIATVSTDVTEQRKEAANYKGQIEAIGKSMAVVEFMLDGTVLAANDIFLNLVGYSLSEVKGQHHSIFVPASEQNTEAYCEFWGKLRRGEHETGEFLRISKNSQEVYIHGSYNPILDADGKPYKVVKYAYDITPTVIARQKSGSVRFIIESVADGAENLRTSVRDIADAMDKCQVRTTEAVGQVDAADQQAKQLTAAANSMSGIVELIANITGQINLLALNATIESARAGDAGRGFAVVASEVKNLANQAKQATDRIGSEIGNLNSISGDVVVALRTIKGAIEGVSEYVIASTAAVKEQSEMSEVISGSIRTAASEAAGIVV